MVDRVEHAGRLARLIAREPLRCLRCDIDFGRARTQCRPGFGALSGCQARNPNERADEQEYGDT